MTMTTVKNSAALLFLSVPMVGVVAYTLYKLALEVWCIAYGLIY